MALRTTTFLDPLLGSLARFLGDAGMACPTTQEGLVELVVALSGYREEGVALFPKVLLCDEIDIALGALGGGEPILLGRGPRGARTVRSALKDCAPLAQRGWVMFLNRAEEDFTYGVFREPVSPVSIDLYDAVKVSSASQRLILLRNLGERAVELVGSDGHRVNVHLSAVVEDAPSPRDEIEQLAAAAGQAVPDELKEQVGSFLRTTLTTALQSGHGTLVAVVGDEDHVPEPLKVDQVPLHPPLDLCDAVRAHLAEGSQDAQARLLGYAALLEGLLSSDGIVVMTTDAVVLAYRAFVKTPATDEPISSTQGGARRRAFGVLTSLVDAEALKGALFRSNDGATRFYKGGA